MTETMMVKYFDGECKGGPMHGRSLAAICARVVAHHVEGQPLPAMLPMPDDHKGSFYLWDEGGWVWIE